MRCKHDWEVNWVTTAWFGHKICKKINSDIYFSFEALSKFGIVKIKFQLNGSTMFYFTGTIFYVYFSLGFENNKIKI